MSKKETTRTRDAVKMALELDDSTFNTVLEALKFENVTEFSPKQFSLIQKYDHLRKNGFLNELQKKAVKCNGDLARGIGELCAEVGENFDDGETYSLKALMEGIARKIERPVKLSQMEEILELAGLGVEEEYSDEDRKALDEALPRYLVRELSRREAGSSEGNIGEVIDRGVSGEVEGLTEKLAGTVANTREGLEETFQREIPRRMLAQLAAAAQSGILGQKIELAREKIAEQKRIAGETTIDVTLAGGENKQLKSAEVKDGNDEGKGG
jgi:hypothetical protein